MGREIDRRDFSVNKVTPARQAELRTLAADESEGLPGEHRVRIAGFDATTGNPSVIVSEAAPAERGNYIQRALEHLQGIGGTLGLEATQSPEYVADPQVQKTSSGAVAVHVQQQYKGIPIFQAAQAVRFTPDGVLHETAGSTVTVARDLEVAPRLSVQEAVLQAAQHVAVPDEDEQRATDQFGESMNLSSVDLTGFMPTVIASFPNKAERQTVLAAGPFGDEIKANLIWFLLGDNLRLAWEIILAMPNYEEQFRTLVDAEDGEILYCRQLVDQIAARGNVFLVDGDGPRQMIDFPRSLADYGIPIPADLPPDFPDTWVAADSTAGYSVVAHLDDDGPMMRGVIRDGVLTFDPADPQGDDQKILNIFYLNCYLHNYFYMRGFREADGNFQQDDFGRGDRVEARAYSGPVPGTASMFTPVDNSSPVMRMGLVASTNRHTAFDSSVVFHEFMHGVTNRLVGGSMNVHALDAIQSAAMGEGFGDFNACIINDTTVVGAWVVGRPGGIRRFRYDSHFPDTFGDLGTGRYTEIHNIGEIWCATLMEMSRAIGKHLSMQLVVDALKLSPANPSFLNMRDSILTALENKALAGQFTADEHVATRSGIWKTFAQFGMGPAARSNGASLSGIEADFNMPEPAEPPQPGARAEAMPNLAIPDNDPTGITSVLTIVEAGRIDRLTVAIDIEHTYIGDLQVSLITSAGSKAILHNRAGANTRNLIKTYTNENTPALEAIAGEQAEGDWRLEIADLEAQDIGTLRGWSIEVGLAETQLAPGAQPLVARAAQPAPDDFKLINGIGPAIESRLHGASILTYAQLAALTPADVVARIGLSGMSAKNVVRQDWVGQARVLALHAAEAESYVEAAPLAIHPADTEVSTGRHRYATFTVELLLGEDSDVRRTRVRHIQEGEQETWAGWEDGRLVRFFVEHAALPRQAPQRAQMQMEPESADESDIGVLRSGARMEEPPADLYVDISDILIEEGANDQRADEAAGVERLRAEMSFHLSGLVATHVAAERTPYFVHILAYMLTTGETTVLAATQSQLQPETLDYTTRIDFAPPEIGRYQLLATVVLSDYNTVGATVGPMLKVIP